MKLKLVITLVMLLLVFVFAVQNAAIIEVRFLFWVVEFPRSLLIFLMLLIGVVVGWFLKPMLRIGND